MENIEFIAAQNLPVTEAEEVDVLCVVNGELKRKPAEGIGGGAYVIDLMDSTELDVGAAQSTITTVNYDDFAQKWWDGCPIVVKCNYMGMSATMHPFGILYNSEDGGMIMMVVPTMLPNTTAPMVIFPVGTWTPPVE